MKRLLILFLGAVLLSAPAAGQEEPRFTFCSRGEGRYFELRLPESCRSSGGEVVAARLGARSPGIYLAYPSQIKPYEASSFFAGMYTGEGACRIEVTVIRYGSERITEERLLARAVFPAQGPEMSEEAWKRYAAAQAQECDGVLKRDPAAAFHQYVRLLASERANVPLFRPGEPEPRWVRVARRPVDLYSITTGALAVQETLQLTEMTEAYQAEGEKNRSIEGLPNVRVPSHPFEEMLAGKTPVVSGLARAVPQDFYYCRFRTLDELLQLLDFIKQWGNHFLKTYAVTARDDHLARKYLGQMLLDTNPVTRELFRRIVGEVAVVGSDPFFLSGSDVTIIIRTSLAPAFETYIEQKAQKAAVLRPDLTRRSLDWLGVSLYTVSTPDRSISCVYGQADGFALVGNSLPAVERVISTLRGKAASLAQAADFRYMRTIYPADAEEEDGFIYLSESFLRNLVGPALKVKEQRRIRCVNELRMIEHGALLFELEKRRAPQSMEELADSGYLPKRALKCPDGGQYSFDPQRRAAACSFHNRLPYLTPHVETTIGSVTEREARDYASFAQQYNSYWRTYFDPIAIRVGVGPRMTFETHILPLIDNSFYNQFRTIAGGEAVNLNGPVLLPEAIATCGGRTNLAAILKQSALAQALNAALGGNAAQAAQSVFDDAAFLAICDGTPLYRFDFSAFAGEAIRSGAPDWLVYMPALTSLQLPSYVALKIKDRKAFDQFMAGVERYLADRSAEQQFGLFAVRLDFAELPAHGGCRVYDIGVKMLSFGVRSYYTAAGDYLYVANRLDLIHRLIDAHGEAGRPQQPVVTGNAAIRFLPRNWKQIRADMGLSWEAKSRQACFANLASVEPLLQVIHSAEPLSEIQEAGNGRTYFCPDGGSYSLKDGRAFCSVHGNPDSPAQPEAPTSTSRIAALLERCMDISIRLSFTERGVATEIAVTQSQEQ